MKSEYRSVEYYKEMLLKEANNVHFFIGVMNAALNPAEGSPSEILKCTRNLMKAYQQNVGLSDPYNESK